MGSERPSALQDALQALLAIDPRDVGCEQTWQLIHRYAEIAAEGGDPEQVLPGIAAHLRSCPPCCEDFRGLENALMTADWVARGGDVG